jgi:hypothetical protein
VHRDIQANGLQAAPELVKVSVEGLEHDQRYIATLTQITL